MTTPQDILDFWFRELSPMQWFSSDEKLDAQIRERFLETYEAALGGRTASWRETPQGRLAEIIVLDQFARNMFRGSAKAFAMDAHALELAREAVRVGDDKKLTTTERHFLYMPYMHSESREVHKETVKLFWSLMPWKWMALLYEYRHKKVIDRFGRYPELNEVLGRTSTPEEIEFLKKHKGF